MVAKGMLMLGGARRDRPIYPIATRWYSVLLLRKVAVWRAGAGCGSRAVSGVDCRKPINALCAAWHSQRDMDGVTFENALDIGQRHYHPRALSSEERLQSIRTSSLSKVF